MRFIPTGVHGIMDYLLGVVLIGVPYVFGFGTSAETGLAVNNAATWVPVALGFALIIYSLFTNYELGLVRKIPMSTHLWLDVASGVLLAVSPWLFGFADRVYWPHLIVGLFEIGAGLMTRTRSDSSLTARSA
jgi:hypothetical protein